jgi:hypothetical protein
VLIIDRKGDNAEYIFGAFFSFHMDIVVLPLLFFHLLPLERMRIPCGSNNDIALIPDDYELLK